MAVANTKEFLACFAFAYFMKYPDYKINPQQHKDEWIETFKGFNITSVKRNINNT